MFLNKRLASTVALHKRIVLDFQNFVSDERLDLVIAGMKRTNDIFDIINLSENQHSEMLKWLFDPREGHGQGDAMLKFKDF